MDTPTDLFREVFDLSPTPAGLLTGAGLFVAVNPAWEAQLGWRNDEVVGHSAVELEIWANADQRAVALADLAAKGVVETKLLFRRRDREIREYLVLMKLFEQGGERWIWFQTRDLSGERALALSEARMRALTEATFEALAMTRDGKIVECNDQLATMLGYTMHELIGIPVARLTAPESADTVRAAISSGTEGPYEHLAKRKDGTTLPVEVRARMIDLGNDRVRISAIRDLTEHHRTLGELQRVIIELKARNTEMEQFVYTVSHDLKSPLVTIKGFIGSITADLDAGRMEHVQNDLRRISNAADKMTHLLEDLLELSRVGRVGTLTSQVSLDDVALGALELVQGALIARGVTVTMERLPKVRGDRGRLLQVFQNLLENAVKYMGDQAEPRVEIGSRATPGLSTVFVRDNGKGIAPQHAERVFGLFEKLDPKSEGTGVGLALVRRIVEFHGGKICVESGGDGLGSTFVIELPLDPPPAA